ncbi:MAG: DNA repair protein RecN [Ignavibacteria bacterium]|nr:DNA repair protein RecN [Ignavibacteria bacterium]
MLEKLIIKNYLLLKNIEIDFSNGFNIITGETGAGKSILINALNLLLGGRADYSIISKNSDKMVIECIITISKDNEKYVYELFKKHKIEVFGNSLIIRRELYSKAYSRCFINDTPVGTNELKELGELIIDIHSQNEHQSLLKKEIHIELVDSYLAIKIGQKFIDKIESYKDEYEQLKIKEKELKEIEIRQHEIEQRRSYIEFQLKEINETNPRPGEFEEIEKNLKTGENAEGIKESLTNAYFNLYDDKGSIIERIKIVEKELSKTGEFDNNIISILNDIIEAATVLKEASKQINILADSINADFVNIEEMRERLYKLQYLKKKYGGSIEEVIKLKEKYEQDINIADNFEEAFNKIRVDIKNLKNSLLKKAGEISKLRKERSKELEGAIVKVLREVGLENTEFKIGFKTTQYTKSFNRTEKDKGEHENNILNINGLDDIEFMVKINKGDEYTSLRKSASGGEISRIMLAVKSVLAGSDKVDILIFDEIDTGISGRIAQKAGRVMKNLSKHRQVIAITHLAQIAALADEHLLVEKETNEAATITKIRKLNNNEKIIEVAKLLSGEKITDSSIKSAKELMVSEK